jgi:hypothetical protein
VTAQPATGVPVVPAQQANRLVELNDGLSLATSRAGISNRAN